MPMTVGTQEVSGDLPRLRWYNDVGYLQGQIAKMMAAQQMGGGGFGQSPTAPTPQRPGTLSFPSGAQTQTSPLEMAMIQQMGGVPNTQGGITPMASGNQPGVTYKPPTKWGIKPTYEQQLTIADIQKKQADMAYQQKQGSYMDSITEAIKAGRMSPQAPAADPSQDAALSYIKQKALEGDEDAINTLRTLGAL